MSAHHDQILKSELNRYQLDALHDGPPSAEGWSDWLRGACPGMWVEINEAAEDVNRAKDSRTHLGRYRHFVRTWAGLLRKGMKAYLWSQAPSSLDWSEPPDTGGLRIGVMDLETQKLAEHVGGFENAHEMKLSFGGVYDVSEQAFKLYGAGQANQLIDDLLAFDLVVGFNHVSFDYSVLWPYREGVVFPEDKQFDLMVDLECYLHRRPGLGALARGTLGADKGGDGRDAVRWYAERELEKLFTYLELDVWATYEVWCHGVKKNHVIWENPRSRTGSKVHVPTEHWTTFRPRTQYSGQMDLFGDVLSPVDQKRKTSRYSLPGARS